MVRRSAGGHRKSGRLEAGQVWVSTSAETRTRTRRVIGLASDKVCYSTGSDSTRWCKPRAFRLWIARYDAVATRTRRPRSLTLRARPIA